MQQHNNFAEKTTVERTDELVRLSDKIYPAIDQYTGGEQRSRKILRLGLNAVAHTLKEKNIDAAGETYRSILSDQLSRGGLTVNEFGAWTEYQEQARELDPVPHVRFRELDELANKYSDVKRATLATDLRKERNASHVTHLSTLALTYAAKYYPDINPNKVATYSLVHDIVEAYAGDTPSYKMTPAERAEKERKELEALQTIERLYGHQFPQLVDTIHSYEHLEDDEAKFTKTMDKVDPHYTHLRNNGFQLLHYYNVKSRTQYITDTNEYTGHIEKYGVQFPDVMDVRLEMVHRVADAIDWPEKEAA